MPRRQVSSFGDSLRIHIGDFGVRVSSDLPRLLQEIAELYPCSEEPQLPEKTIQMEVRESRTRFGRSRYAIYGDHREITRERTSREVFPYLEWGINLRIISTRPEFVQLHAASMSCDGNGFVFAGESGCGKSTLAACLLAGGWQYLCDEFALINRHTLFLQPFPKALCIKSGSFAVVRRAGLRFARRRDYIKGRKGRVAYINPRHAREDAISAPCPVRAIFFPTYVANHNPTCTPISRAQGMIELAGCVFNHHAFGDRGLSVLHEVVQNARCYRLEVGDAEKTRRLLDEVVRREIGQGPTNDSLARKAVGRNPMQSRGVPLRMSRRDMLRSGVKMAYVVPTIATFLARPAFAAGSNPSGACSTGVQTGGLCETDADCCSGDCDFGVCN